MADSKLSALAEKTTVAGTEELLINDGGTSKKITQANLLLGVDNTAADATAITINADETVTLSTHLNLGDSDIIKLGASADLQILHDGSHSYVKDTGTGGLRLVGNQVILKNAADNETMLHASEDGAVILYYDNAAKLHTQADGIEVTGDTDTDTLNVSGVATFGSLSDGSITVTAWVDEDNMSSNSATLIPTQQSVKAYVDSSLLTEDTLAELNDTNITSPADASLLLYDTGTSTWRDGAMSGDATISDTGAITVATLNQNTTGSAATLTTPRTIGGTSFNGSANIVPATITVADTTDTSSYVALFESATGDLGPKTDAGITYNAGTGVLTATGLSGPLTGSSTGLSGSPNITVGTIGSGNITTSGYLAGPASFTIDPATVGDNTGTVVIAGNLQVDGTTTTINSTTVAIDDLNFSIATDAADSAAANGAGITIGGASATLLYTHATTSWDMNKPLNVTGAFSASGAITGTLATAAQTNITSLGTLTSLTVDSVSINSATIGHTSDTDLMTLGSGILTVAGEVSATTLDIGGTNIASTAAELNLLDGSAKSTSSITIADADGFICIDGTTTKQIPASDLKTYISSVPSTITVADTTDSSCFVGLWESATGDLAPKTDAAITYNASSGSLTATTFIGALTGNASGSSGSCTGNAATATALATPRTIGGTSFDGTANIVPATAVAVTGAAQSAITSVGTMTSLTVDDITLNSSTISDAGDLTLDVGGDILLDADGGDAVFKDAGAEYARLSSGVSGPTFSMLNADGDRYRWYNTDSGDGDFQFGYTIASGSEALLMGYDSSAGTWDLRGTWNFNTNATVGGTLGVTGVISPTTHIDMPDNAKLLLGTGDDLEIYHDASNSYVSDAGTGSLILKGSTVEVHGTDGGKLALFDSEGRAALYYNNAEKIRTVSGGAQITGNLGVGTDSPATGNAGNTAGLHIKNSAPFVRFQDDTGTASDWELYAFDDKFYFYDNTDSAVRMTLDGSGNLGIGLTPVNKLDINGNLQVGNGRTDNSEHHAKILGTPYDTGGTSPICGMYINGHSANNNIRIGGGTDGTSAASKVSISTTALTTGAYEGAVNFQVDASGNCIFQASGTATIYNTSDLTGVVINGTTGLIQTSRAGTSVELNRTGGSGTRYIMGISYDGSYIGSINTTNGSNAVYATSSDYRLKENVATMTGALTRLGNLKPVRFNWIADETNTLQDGFLAHEAAAIVPEAVAGVKDAVYTQTYVVTPALGEIYNYNTDAVLETGVAEPVTPASGTHWRETAAEVTATREAIDPQGIDQSKLVPLLVGAVQELTDQVTVLQTRIAALEAG
jgi:hypothetical protein